MCSSFILDIEENKQKEKQPAGNSLTMEMGWKSTKSKHTAIPSAW